MNSLQVLGRCQLTCLRPQCGVQQPTGRSSVTCLLQPAQLPSDLVGSSLRRLPELRPLTYGRQQPSTVAGGLTSKLDFLLAPRTLINLSNDARSSPACRKINHDIKMAADWQTIRAIVDAHSDGALDETNVAFALFRIGCLFAFLPPQQQAELKACGLVADLTGLACAKLASMRPTELTRLVDAWAKLHHHPGASTLDAILLQAEPLLPRFDATQLPLFMWGLAVLRHRPSVETLFALDDQVLAKADRMTPQGVSLTLWAYQTFKHQAGQEVLKALSGVLLKRLQFFKSHEVANCLSAFAAMQFRPGQDLLQAVAKRAGRSLDAAPRKAAAGKRSLVPESARVAVPAVPKVAALKRSLSGKLDDLKTAGRQAKDQLAGSTSGTPPPRTT